MRKKHNRDRIWKIVMLLVVIGAVVLFVLQVVTVFSSDLPLWLKLRLL